MNICPNCGREFYINENDHCGDCLFQELKDAETLSRNLSDILDKVANALHGGRKQNGLWSFHDLPELATKAIQYIAELEDNNRANHAS